MSSEPQNKLESALAAAATDPAARPAFYRTLAESDLFIVREGAPPKTSGSRIVEADEELKIRFIDWNGKSTIPVFSSLPRLQAWLQDEAGYLGLNAIELFKIIRGTEVILNPGAPYGKEFTVSEIESLIDGSVWKPQKTFVAEKEAQVMLGQPSRYPTELADSLSRYFATKKNVKKAYLAHYSNPATGDPPHTLIAVDFSGSWNDILAGAGVIAQSVKVPDPPIDFLGMTGKPGLEDYFRKDCKPFYKRKVFGIF